jgi:hypothetical protein
VALRRLLYTVSALNLRPLLRLFPREIHVLRAALHVRYVCKQTDSSGIWERFGIHDGLWVDFWILVIHMPSPPYAYMHRKGGNAFLARDEAFAFACKILSTSVVKLRRRDVYRKSACT